MTRISDKRLGEILIKLGILKEEHVEKTLSLQKDGKNKALLGELLIESNLANEEDIIRGLKTQYKIAYLPLDKYSIDNELINSFPRDIALRHSVIPIHKCQDTITVAIANPPQDNILNEIEKAVKCKVRVVFSSASQIKNKIQECYNKQDTASPDELSIEDLEKVISSEDNYHLAQPVKKFDTVSSLLDYKNEYEELLNEAKELLSRGFYYPCIAMCTLLAEHIIRNILRNSVIGKKSYITANPQEPNMVDTFPINLICKFLLENELIDETAVSDFECLLNLKNKYLQIYVRPTEKNTKLCIDLLENIIRSTA